MIRTLLLSIITFALTACGFTPMHAGPGGAVFDKLSIVEQGGANLTDEQIGFLVQQRLRDRVGQTSKPAHELRYTINSVRVPIGISDADIATRYDTFVTATYSLVETKTGDVLDKGSVRSVTTFGAPFDPYGTVAADSNARQQASKEVADRLLTSVAQYYAKAKPAT
ncbi:hypothetical protein ACJ3XI_11115 [Litorimonas sp. RW-G-Af-16]|uniref:hypothetical protein n=1 Tax=Litorimonas sp. RW-G-Af-16 TaxID=3241168 RepID=UPI00390C602E